MTIFYGPSLRPINQTLAGDQGPTAIIGLSNGNFAVCWNDDSQLTGDASYYASVVRIYSPSGAPLTDETLINTTTNNSQIFPHITALAKGSFVAVWQENSSHPQETWAQQIKGQIFDASGNKIGPSEFLIGDTSGENVSAARVARLADGGFVVAWRKGPSGAGASVAFRTYDPDGTARSPETTLPASVSVDIGVIDVVGLSAGGFAVAWSNSPAGGQGETILGQIFDNSGTPLPAGGFSTTDSLPGTNLRPRVLELSNGNLAVLWTSFSSGSTGDSQGVVGQIVTPGGTLVGAPFQINTTTPSAQTDVSGVALPGGGFFAVWQDGSASPDAPYTDTTRGQQFDNQGNKVGAETLIDPTIAGRIDGGAVGVLSNGQLAVAMGDKSSGDYNVAVQLLSLAVNATAPTFATPTIVGTPPNPWALAVGDLNNDGHPDAIVPDVYGTSLEIMLGDGAGVPHRRQHLLHRQPPGSGRNRRFQPRRQPRHRHNELRQRYSLRVFLGDGTGHFAPRTDYQVGHFPYGITTTDVNGDGVIDLIAGSYANNSVTVLLGDGSGGFSSTGTTNSTGSPPIAIAVADMNGDGISDLVTSNGIAGSVSVLFGDGTGAFTSRKDYTVGLWLSGVQTADLNSDGLQDLVTWNPVSGTVSVLLGDGTGGFSSQANFQAGSSDYYGALADMNGDGHIDIVTANYESNTISILLGDGTGNFAPPINYVISEFPYALSVADMNGDGRPDIVATLVQADGGAIGLPNTRPADQRFAIAVMLNTTPNWPAPTSSDTVHQGTATTDTLLQGTSRTGTINAEPMPSDIPISLPDGTRGYVDKDWYRVTLAPGELYTFNAHVLSMSTGLVDISLYGQNGTQVAKPVEGADPSFTFDTTYQAAAAQTYYLAVSAGGAGNTWKTATGGYSVNFTGQASTTVDIVPGDLSSSVELLPGTTTGAIDAQDILGGVDKDFYKVTLNGGEIYSFIASAGVSGADPLGQITMKLFDPSGNLVLIPNANDSGQNPSFNFPVPGAGPQDYHVAISSANPPTSYFSSGSNTSANATGQLDPTGEYSFTLTDKGPSANDPLAFVFFPDGHNSAIVPGGVEVYGFGNPSTRKSINTSITGDLGRQIISHPAVDIEAPLNTEVDAFADGKVVQRGSNDALGNYIILHHLQPVAFLPPPISNAADFYTLYAHLSAKGQIDKDLENNVKAGQKIGEIGRGGSEIVGDPKKGILHFELRLFGSDDPNHDPYHPSNWTGWDLPKVDLNGNPVLDGKGNLVPATNIYLKGTHSEIELLADPQLSFQGYLNPQRFLSITPSTSIAVTSPSDIPTIGDHGQLILQCNNDTPTTITLGAQGQTGIISDGASGDILSQFLGFLKITVNGGGLGDNIGVKALSTAGVARHTVFFNGYDGDDTIDGSTTDTTIVATGDSGNDSLLGGPLNDDLSGGDGDDTLVGGTGNDTMTGGPGNDTYDVQSHRDLIIENSGEGDDTVTSSIGYHLPDNVESLTLTSTAPWGWGNPSPNTLTGNPAPNALRGGTGDDTISGLDGNDSLTGGIGADSLSGDAGDDTLDGSAGPDTLAGGPGNDTYIVNTPADLIIEQPTDGTDTVLSSSPFFHLADNLEALTLTGTGDFIGWGNAGANSILGNPGNNDLRGGAGHDTLDGGAGADTLSGGSGPDLFVFNAGQANGDLITDFLPGLDHLRFAGFGTPAAGATLLPLGGGDWQIVAAGGAVETLHFANTPAITAADYTFI